MKKQNRAPSLWIALLVLLVGVGSFSCHRSRPARQMSTLEDHLASGLLGRQVENEDGQELATLNDLLLDLRRGKAGFGLLSSGGFLGLGKHLKIVPCQALSTRTTKKDVLALDITKNGWEHAPALKSKAALALRDPVLAKTIERYYQMAATENDAMSPPAAEPAQPSIPTPTGHDPSIDPTHTLKSVRDLTGTAVVTRQQQKIGRIIDFLVDLTGHKASYAIVARDSLFRRGERFAVPLALLSQGKERLLVIDATRSMFEHAQEFDPANWLNNRMEFGRILRFLPHSPAHIVSPEPGNILTAL